MEANIDTAAIEAPIPLALERTAPADTPAALSSHDAAAVLRKLRQKDTTQPRSEAGTGSAPPAAPEPGKESPADPRITSGDADNAAPVDSKDGRERPDATQDPGERTESADPGQDAPPIEPPRSWTKEDKELFASLT